MPQNISLRERFALHDRLMAYVAGLPADNPAKADLVIRLALDDEHLRVIKAMMKDERFIGVHSGSEEDNDALHMKLIDRKASDDPQQRYRAKMTQALANVFEEVATIDDPEEYLSAHTAMLMGIANGLSTICAAVSPMIAPAVTTMLHCIYRGLRANPVMAKTCPALPALMALAMDETARPKDIVRVWKKYKIGPDDVIAE